MPFEAFKWISAQFRGKNIYFPNNTTWCLTEVLSEKAVYFDADPAEASAVFACKQQDNQKLDCEAVVRVRMQYDFSPSVSSR
jgi:hypothetical protein